MNKIVEKNILLAHRVYIVRCRKEAEEESRQ